MSIDLFTREAARQVASVLPGTSVDEGNGTRGVVTEVLSVDEVPGEHIIRYKIDGRLEAIAILPVIPGE